MDNKAKRTNVADDGRSRQVVVVDGEEGCLVAVATVEGGAIEVVKV